MRIEPLAVPAGAAVFDVLPRLATALEGGHPIAPYAAGSPPPALPPHDVGILPSDLAVVVGTSGSTGTPKLAMLGTRALRASIESTHTRLSGPGQWLLTMPAHHIAGLQVLLRSLVAGTAPHVMDLSGGFTPAKWTDAVNAMPDTGHPTYVSLVPTSSVASSPTT
ncbi:MAG: AMP-binding protein, partial [Terracoccus sp.]